MSLQPEPMPKDIFVRGWDLLLAQPWGRRYATVQDITSAKAAATQLAFYYKKLGTYPVDGWLGICELFAQGDHWPSVDEMRQALNHNLPPRLHLEYTNGRTEMPEAVALCLAHAETHRTSWIEAVQAVLPGWLKQNQDHEDYAKAAVLYDHLRSLKPANPIERGAVVALRAVGA